MVGIVMPARMSDRSRGDGMCPTYSPPAPVPRAFARTYLQHEMISFFCLYTTHTWCGVLPASMSGTFCCALLYECCCRRVYSRARRRCLFRFVLLQHTGIYLPRTRMSNFYTPGGGGRRRRAAAGAPWAAQEGGAAFSARLPGARASMDAAGRIPPALSPMLHVACPTKVFLGARRPFPIQGAAGGRPLRGTRWTDGRAPPPQPGRGGGGPCWARLDIVWMVVFVRAGVPPPCGMFIARVFAPPFGRSPFAPAPARAHPGTRTRTAAHTRR